MLAALQAALLALTAWDKSDTADEPSYIVGGMFQWVRGDYLENCHAPPLPRWAYAVALRVVDPDLFTAWRETNRWTAPHPLFTRSASDLRRNLFATRLTTVLVTVAGGLFLWHAAFLAFGWPASLVTHILWCFSPSLLAHGSLATLDAWATSMLCVAIWCTVRLWQAPTLLRWLALGVALGLAGGSKVTSLIFAPVAIGIGLLARHSQGHASRPRPLVGLTVAFLGFAALLWTLYGFRVGIVDAAAPCGTTRGVWDLRVGPVPFPLWFEGALLQYRRGKVGFQNYLLGEVKRTGWWWFYVAVLALKVTIGAQLLAVLAVVMRRRIRLTGGALVDLAILACPLALFMVMSAGETQGGVRYILPAFPFAMVWLGRVVGALAGTGEDRRRRAARGGHRRGPGRPPALPDVLQPVDRRPAQRPLLPDPGRRLGPGPAPPRGVAGPEQGAPAALQLLRWAAGGLGHRLSPGALRAEAGGTVRAARHGGPPPEARPAGLLRLAHGRPARRAHRLVHLPLRRATRQAAAAEGAAPDRPPVLAERSAAVASRG